MKWQWLESATSFSLALKHCFWKEKNTITKLIYERKKIIGKVQLFMVINYDFLWVDGGFYGQKSISKNQASMAL